MSIAAKKSMDYHMMRKIDSMTYYYLAAKTPGIRHEMACTDIKFCCKSFLFLSTYQKLKKSPLTYISV